MKFLKNKLNIIFIVLGISLFSYFVYSFGLEVFNLIKLQINFFYLFLFLIVLILSLIPYTLRFKVILDSYGKKIPFLTLMKHYISSFSISYITPASRLGGEPVRIYMMKKECNIDYKTGTSVVILDKFVEILGSALYGVIGLIVLLSLTTSSIFLFIKIIFGTMIFIVLISLFYMYYRLKNGKGVFLPLFLILRLHKISKLNNKHHIFKDIDLSISNFFKYHKKAFLLSFMFYCISGIIFIIKFKLLLLSLGMSLPIHYIILIINLWGLLNFVPTPGSFGFLELGQFELFKILGMSGTIGLSMVLILRAGHLLVVSLGLFFVSKFGFKNIK